MNTSVNSPGTCFPVIAVHPVLYASIAVIIMCFTTCVFAAMALSKSITKRVRMPLMNLCVSDFVTGIQMLLFAVTNMDSVSPLCVCGHFIMVFSGSVSSTVIFLLSVDRCVCLYFETSYMIYATNKRVRAMYGTVWIVLPVLTYVRTGNMVKSNTTFLTMNMSHREIVFVYCSMFVRCLTLLFTVGTILKMRAIRNRMPAVKGEFQNTSKLIRIICMYQFMYVPLGIYYLISVTKPDLKDSLNLYRQYAALMMMSTSMINPLLYTLRFTECRLSMLIIVCCWNKTMSRRIEYKKKQLLAPFLLTMEIPQQRNSTAPDIPHSVIVLDVVSEEDSHRTEIIQQAVSVIDVPSPPRMSPTPRVITVNPAA